MRALIMVLLNKKRGTYHPIWYQEYPLPGRENAVIRYKSKGHHATGFATMELALEEVDKHATKLGEQGYSVKKDIDVIIEWPDDELPVDIQLRPADDSSN